MGDNKGKAAVRVAMFTPGGMTWHACHDHAVADIRAYYPAACTVTRWRENGLQYEDYKDATGTVLVQLEFAGPPVTVPGFTYTS